MNQTGWRNFIKLCLASKDEKALTELFDLFLTMEEKDSIATRCLIVKELLKQNKPQREISQELNVSIAKITRGSNELKRIPTRLAEFLKTKLL